MRVILSRKGFDSANGGIVSPILEDDTMISFPIPSNDLDCYSDLQYKGILYSKILSDLNYKGGEYCHIDPDLNQNRMVKKRKNWEPAFGQINSSATYLINTVGIKPGDIFLFFGNFHCVSNIDGCFKYIKKSGDFYKDNDLQVIWGYLQVGRIIDNPVEQKRFYWHPHSIDRRTENETNLIFTASETLSFDSKLSGAGLLKYDQKRVLTQKNCTKANWKKNEIYDTDHIIGNRKNSAKDPENAIYYSGIWQELGLAESEECSLWAKSIILD